MINSAGMAANLVPAENAHCYKIVSTIVQHLLHQGGTAEDSVLTYTIDEAVIHMGMGR